jgi:hypothetical protein
VLAHERGDILRAFVDKGDTFARTFLASGTYGFIPGHASAYTQPLYGFVLVPIYWIAGRTWLSVGLGQIAVAIATAWLVYEIGRAVAAHAVGLAASLVTTIHPYLVWHDVHMNREILDELLAAAVVLVVVRSRRLTPARGALLGGLLGLAILGNVRLAALPVLFAAFLVGSRRPARQEVVGALLVLVAAGAVVAPWVVRNRVSVGCFAVTTDARALWKANNPNTYRTLTHGKWIDAVPPIPGAPPSAQDAWQTYERTGRVVPVDECAQASFYQHRVFRYWRDHPGDKLQLAGLSAQMLWQPNVVETQGRPGTGTAIDTLRRTAEPAFMIALYVLAALGALVLPRRFVLLAALLLGYQTLLATIFVGATRYRVPWDFLLGVLAAGALVWALARVRLPAGVVRRPAADR